MCSKNKKTRYILPTLVIIIIIIILAATSFLTIAMLRFMLDEKNGSYMPSGAAIIDDSPEGDSFEDAYAEVTHDSYLSIDKISISEQFDVTTDGYDTWMECKLWIDFDTCKVMYKFIDGTEHLGNWKTETPIFEGGFSQEEGDALLMVLEQYKVLEWKDGDHYAYIWDGGRIIQGKNDAEYVRRGDFFCISPEWSKGQYYIGLSEDERRYRSDAYDGSVRISFGTQENYQDYKAYGVPEGYNEVMDELWNFGFSHLEGVPEDIAEGANNWERVTENGRETLFEKYPYMKKNTEEVLNSEGIWYFSFYESFGAADSGISASVVYQENHANYHDGVDKRDNLTYDAIHFHEDVYYMDSEGIPQLYAKADDWSNDNSNKYELMTLDSTDREKLIEILKKYEITEWKDSSYYASQPEPEYVRQGNFFNLRATPDLGINDTDAEYSVRSYYRGFLNIYDKDGRQIRLIFDNSGVPDGYHEFRKDLWDFTVECAKTARPYATKELDWRLDLDERGKEYLKLFRINQEKVKQQKPNKISGEGNE